MKKRTWISILLLILMMTTIACGISFADSDKKPGDEEIELRLTREAIQKTQTAAAASPDDAPKPPKDESPPDQQSPPDTDPGGGTPCNESKFVSETIPDGTVFEPGETFTKSWTIRNTGGCDWTTNYKFVFEEGDQMGGTTSMNVPSVIEKGEKITFQLDLTAPSAEGNYTGVWRLKAADGEKLGKYWVKIKVESGSPPPPAFAVTSVTFYMPHTTIDMGCPGDINVKAEITTNAAGNVTYHWEDSAGGASVEQSANFTEAGKKIVDYNVLVSSSGPYQADLYINHPNHQWFGPKEFTVNCTP